MSQSNDIKKKEDRIQQECVIHYNNTYCRTTCNPRCMVYHIPNQQQQHLIPIGVLPGASDLVIIHRVNTHTPAVTAYFEVKTPEGRQSPKQIEFQQRIEALGLDYYLIRSKEDFISHIQAIELRILSSGINTQ